MKRIKLAGLILFVLLLSGISGFCQDIYYVTLVKGEVTRSNKVLIKVGDKLGTEDKVIFSKKDGKLILLHPRKGRFVLEPGTNKAQPTGEFLTFIKNSLQVQTQKIKLSSRGEEMLEQFLKVNPAVNSHLLLIGDMKIPVASSGFKIKDPDNDFFFLQYTSPDGKMFNHKLTVIHDSLIISKTDLLFDGRYPGDNEEVKLGFAKNYATDKKITKIISFKPVLMTTEECRNILLSIRESLKAGKERVVEEAMTELYYNYGKPDMDVVCAIYDSL